MGAGDQLDSRDGPDKRRRWFRWRWWRWWKWSGSGYVWKPELVGFALRSDVGSQSRWHAVTYAMFFCQTGQLWCDVGSHTRTQTPVVGTTGTIRGWIPPCGRWEGCWRGTHPALQQGSGAVQATRESGDSGLQSPSSPYSVTK